MNTQAERDSELIYVEKIIAVVDYIRRAGLAALNDIQKDNLLNMTARQGIMVSAVQHALYQDSRGITLGNLAREMRMSVSAASHLVDTMVENGLLVRNVHEDDRRSVRITLSDRGKQCAEVSRRAMDGVMRELTADLPDEENQRRLRDIDYLYSRAYPAQN